jgi:Acetyltransferases, including N-acetylases of ribosomal proteins
MDFSRPAPRVLLRQWTDADLAPFAAMNADPLVMRHFPALLTFEESRSAFDRYRTAIDERGWGFWAVEVEGEFAGLTGLAEPSFVAHFTPCIEIGWRFHPKFWGRGLAFAAAQQAEHYAFTVLHLAELVSFTAVQNEKSRALMQRLGFTRDLAGDFQHPKIPTGHPLRPHVLYRKDLSSATLASSAPAQPSSSSPSS